MPVSCFVHRLSLERLLCKKCGDRALLRASRPLQPFAKRAAAIRAAGQQVFYAFCQRIVHRVRIAHGGRHNPVLHVEQQELPEQFEVAMKELQAIVQSMENQVLSLDEALKAYERGMLLSRICQQKLDDAQLQVQVLQDNQLRPLAQAEQDGEDE